MTDGNIHAAQTRLTRAVARLCDPRTAIYHDGPHTAPSLYYALADSLPGRQGETKTPAKSLPPLWIDAHMLLTSIDKQARAWVRTPGDTPRRLVTLSRRSWRPQDTAQVSDMARTITGWADQITGLLDPAARKTIPIACPACGRRHVHRVDSAGERVRRDALEIGQHGCTCLHCDSVWTPDRYLFLARLLGFELPAGVLE